MPVDSPEYEKIPVDEITEGLSADSKNEFSGPYQILELVEMGYEPGPEGVAVINTPLKHYEERYPEGHGSLGEADEQKIDQFNNFVDQYNESLNQDPENHKKLLSILQEAMNTLY